MLKKDLLLSGGKQKLDGIWEITVGTLKSNSAYETDTYGYNMFQGFGTVVQKDPIGKVLGTNGESFSFLAGCSSYATTGYPGYAPKTTLNFDEKHLPNLSDTVVYLHIKKGTQVYSLTFYYDLNVRLCINEELMLFNADDLGKTYRMYIGPLDTPPPVALTHCSSSNSSSYGRVA